MAMLIAVLGGTVFGLLLLVGSTRYHAWALTTLWSWYAVPVFGLPVLSYAAAVGMSTIIGLFQHPTFIKSEYTENVWVKFASQLLAPAIAVLIGWIARFWL